MTRRVRIQFYIRNRGAVAVDVVPMPYDQPETLARSAVGVALERFNKRWPGARREELHVTGMTDGERTIDGRGHRAATVPLDQAGNR